MSFDSALAGSDRTPSMDPYVSSPSAVSPPPPSPGLSGPSQGKPGRPCLSCGSTNTGDEAAFRHRPSLIGVIFFGWLFLLVRTAFSKHTEVCRDCGAVRRYKSVGSCLALLLLIVTALWLYGESLH